MKGGYLVYLIMKKLPGDRFHEGNFEIGRTKINIEDYRRAPNKSELNDFHCIVIFDVLI